MVREYDGPIERLSDAGRARRLLWFFFLNCGHGAKLDPRNVIVLAGDVTLNELRRKLKCRRCGQRRGYVVPNDERWAER